MRIRASLLCPLALTGCILDYQALRGAGTADGGAGPDAGPLPEELAAYAAVISGCGEGSSLVLADGFDGSLDPAWHGPRALWDTRGGVLAADLGENWDYWNDHLLRPDLSLADLWLRVDVAVESPAAFPQIHLRVDPAHPSQYFHALRLAGDSTGLGIVRQRTAGNQDVPDVSSGTFEELPLHVFHRLVFMARTSTAGGVLLRGGVYALDSGQPALVPGSVVSAHFGAPMDYGPGHVALGGWEGSMRFDALAVYRCGPR